MSINSYITLFSEHEHAAPDDLLTQVMATLGADRIALAYRTIGPDRDWAAHKSFAVRQADKADAILEIETTPTECVARNKPWPLEHSLFRPGCCVRILLGQTSLGARVNEVSRIIANELNESLSFTGPWVAVGWHDIFESAPIAKDRFISRAFLSITYESTNAPRSPSLYMNRFFDNHDISRLKMLIELVTGPLTTECYCSM